MQYNNKAIRHLALFYIYEHTLLEPPLSKVSDTQVSIAHTPNANLTQIKCQPISIVKNIFSPPLLTKKQKVTEKLPF